MRNRELDILRAVAVLLVIGRHGGGPEVWRNVGWVGVDLFFVLSGFLISGLLFVEYKKTGGINWRRFFIRRGFKIYPAFYAMIFVTLLWSIARHHPIHLKAFLPEVLFYQSYQSDRVWEHTWSLAVEEHFYILLPALLLIMLLFRRKKDSANPFRIIPLVWASLAAMGILLRSHLTYSSSHVGRWWQDILYPTHLRIDSLFFGVFVGYLYHFHGEKLKRFMANPWARLSLLVSSLLLVSTCFVFSVDSAFMLSFGLTALYVGFGGILLAVVCSGSDGLSEARLGRKRKFGNLFPYVGMYSYSIYLWHPMISQHIRQFEMLIWPKVTDVVVFWSYVVVSLTVGILLSRIIEYPTLHLRDRLFPPIHQRDKMTEQNSQFRCS